MNLKLKMKPKNHVADQEIRFSHNRFESLEVALRQCRERRS